MFGRLLPKGDIGPSIRISDNPPEQREHGGALERGAVADGVDKGVQVVRMI